MSRSEREIQKLPQDLKEELNAFVDFLFFKAQLREEGVKHSVKKKFSFKWEGALKNMKKEFTSLSLQKQILKMRVGKK